MDKETTIKTMPDSLNEAETKLSDYLLKGIYQNIYECNIAQSMNDEIARYADSINQNGYARFFYLVQCAFAKQDAIEVAKMFDKDSTANSTRSIPNILSHMKNNVDSFVRYDKTILTNFFVKAGYNPAVIQSWNDRDMIPQLVKHYEQELSDKSSHLYKVLQIVKTYRDKRIAHNDDVIDPMALIPLWEHSKYLCDYADRFASFIFLCILGTHSSNIGNEGKKIANIVGPIVHQLKPVHEVLTEMRQLPKQSN